MKLKNKILANWISKILLIFFLFGITSKVFSSEKNFVIATVAAPTVVKEPEKPAEATEEASAEGETKAEGDKPAEGEDKAKEEAKPAAEKK